MAETAQELCVKCGQPGRFRSYSRRGEREGQTWRDRQCVKCKNAHRRKWRRRRGAKGRAQEAKYMRSYWPDYRRRRPHKVPGTKQYAKLNPERHLFLKMQHSSAARKKNRHALKMTFAEFLAEIGGSLPKRCPVLGLEMKITRGAKRDTSPTVDRIDNDRPYERGNIAIICLRANMLKRDGTADEHRKIARWMGRMARRRPS